MIDDSLRVLSCNLRSGGARVAALIDSIERLSIDVVCAQELSVRLADAIAEVLPHGNMSHEHIHRGNGIASRNHVAASPITMPKRNGWVARLSPRHWPGLPSAVEIVNVHISGPHLWPYFPRRLRRRAQLDALLAERARKADVPHAVFGDFNASPIWPAYRRMAAAYADGVVESGESGRAITGTWPCIPALGISGLIRIDHCFLWRLSAISARTVELPGSDHLGLLVDLDISTMVAR